MYCSAEVPSLGLFGSSQPTPQASMKNHVVKEIPPVAGVISTLPTVGAMGTEIPTSCVVRRAFVLALRISYKPPKHNTYLGVL